jgi:hypothetical protein
LILALETRPLACDTQFFAATFALNQTLIAVLTPFALTTGRETVRAEGLLALFAFVQDVGLRVGFPAGLAMDDTFRTAGEIRVALFNVPVGGVRDVTLGVDLALVADRSPTPATSGLASVAKLLLTVLAKEEGFIVCHFFIAKSLSSIIAYLTPLLLRLSID